MINSPLILTKIFRFEASHVLPLHQGQCSRLHGHSWMLEVSVKGRVDPKTNFVLDYADLKEIVQSKVINILDHRHLGQGSVDCNSTTHHATLGEAFYPSSENLVKWIVKQLEDSKLGELLYEVTLFETCTAKCTWRRGER